MIAIAVLVLAAVLTVPLLRARPSGRKIPFLPLCAFVLGVGMIFQSPAQAAQWKQVCVPDFWGGQTCTMKCVGLGCPLGGPQRQLQIRPNPFGGVTGEEKCAGLGCPLGGPQWKTECVPNWSGGMTCGRKCSGLGCPLGY